MVATLDRGAIDVALLCDVVSHMLGREGVELGEWDCRSLAYDVKNIGAQGAYRFSGMARSDGASYPWSVVLKIVRNPAGLEAAPGYLIPLYHRDAFPANLFTRGAPDGQHQTVAIDWAFVGVGPVGEELAPLIGMRANPDPGLALADVEETVFDGYVTGLREAAWHDDPRLVRLGYAATAPLRYSLSTAATMALTILQGDGVEALEQRRQQPIERIVEQDAAFVACLLDLVDEARRLLPLIDVQ